jgi:hypothetical protein
MDLNVVAKCCPLCGRQFTARELLTDIEVQAIGMMDEDQGFGQAVYFFRHNSPNCGTGFTVPAEEFEEFITEEIPKNRLLGSSACGGHCEHLNDLSECHAQCSNAPYRRFLIHVLRAPWSRR